MLTSRSLERLSFICLCSGPFLATALASIRAFRIPIVHQTIGGLVFAALAMATWMLARQGIRSHLVETRLGTVSGLVLLLPVALISLLWVGLGPPWQANPTENQMRYVVLVVIATLVVAGFTLLKEALTVAGERIFSTTGFAAIVLAGPPYLIGETLPLAAYSAQVRTGEVPPIFVSLSEWQDILLFFGGALTYVATSAFAIALFRAGWLGRGASRMFFGLSIIALLFLVTRGLQFPDPAASSMPWYHVPGFVAGIPAVPFFIPYFFGVALFRHANTSDDPR